MSIRHELRFRSLCDPDHVYAFPCDAAGCVDMDSLSEQCRNDYLFARALVGIEMARPEVGIVNT